MILLGEQWLEVADFLGLYSLFGAFSTVLSHYCSEIYRSLGKPKLSFVVQLIYITGLIPIISWGVKQPFDILTISRSFMRLYMILIHSVLMWIILKLSMLKFIKNIAPSVICAFLMGIFGICVNSIMDNIFWNLLCVGFCAVFYFGTICLLFPKLRDEGLQFLKKKG